jgi:hypothetical protein
MRIFKLIAISSAIALFACNNSGKDENKPAADSAKSAAVDKPADPSELHVKAQFTDYSLGDASHFIFKDEAGKDWDFASNEDSSYKFAVELPKDKTNESNQGWGANKDLQGKWFDITYTVKDQAQYPDGPMGKVMVITKVKGR